MRATTLGWLGVLCAVMAGCSEGEQETPTAPAAASGPRTAADDYFPVGIGYRWVYRGTTTRNTPGETCTNNGRTHTYEIIGRSDSTGDPIYERRSSPCGERPTLLRIHDGDVKTTDTANWYLHLDFPPQLRKRWPAGLPSGAVHEWDEHYDTYTVAAGTFRDCWRRKQDGQDAWEVYCGGVGMVRSHSTAWGQDEQMELVETNLVPAAP